MRNPMNSDRPFLLACFHNALALSRPYPHFHCNPITPLPFRPHQQRHRWIPHGHQLRRIPKANQQSSRWDRIRIDHLQFNTWTIHEKKKTEKHQSHELSIKKSSGESLLFFQKKKKINRKKQFRPEIVFRGSFFLFSFFGRRWADNGLTSAGSGQDRRDDEAPFGGRHRWAHDASGRYTVAGSWRGTHWHRYTTRLYQNRTGSGVQRRYHRCSTHRAEPELTFIHWLAARKSYVYPRFSLFSILFFSFLFFSFFFLFFQVFFFLFLKFSLGSWICSSIF